MRELYFYIGNHYISLIGMLVTTMPFYFAVLEQYYTGELILPVVNGVDDGSIFYVLFAFMSAYYGCDIWKVEYSIFGYPPARVSHMVAYFLLFALSICTFEK